MTAASAAPDKVLFVGNSFSYYNNGLHNSYKKLVIASGTGVRTRLMTISGGYLREHLPGLPAMAASEDWDVIVLQGYSRGPIEDATAGSFRESAREAARISRNHGAMPVFFMTWAYTDRPEMTDRLDRAYTGIADELGARVVPVGLAFTRVTNERPSLALRMTDGKHPTPAGTYLSACVFYAALNGESPEDLSYVGGLDVEDAVFLQRIAWETVTKKGSEQLL